jgi:hypothetical protein
MARTGGAGLAPSKGGSDMTTIDQTAADTGRKQTRFAGIHFCDKEGASSLSRLTLPAYCPTAQSGRKHNPVIWNCTHGA